MLRTIMSMPQLLLQGFILFRLVLEPLRRPGASTFAAWLLLPNQKQHL